MPPPASGGGVPRNGFRKIGAAVDDLTGVAGKTIATVALDFARITINPEVVLYLVQVIRGFSIALYYAWILLIEILR